MLEDFIAVKFEFVDNEKLKKDRNAFFKFLSDMKDFKFIRKLDGNLDIDKNKNDLNEFLEILIGYSNFFNESYDYESLLTGKENENVRIHFLRKETLLKELKEGKININNIFRYFDNAERKRIIKLVFDTFESELLEKLFEGVANYELDNFFMDDYNLDVKSKEKIQKLFNKFIGDKIHSVVKLRQNYYKGIRPEYLSGYLRTNKKLCYAVVKCKDRRLKLLLPNELYKKAFAKDIAEMI